jgi:hypothetical protein
MNTSKQWIEHFNINATQQRIDWSQPPSITAGEVAVILRSLQAWQLGETSDGSNLLRASTRYARLINDPEYVLAMRLFIKEEQKHGNNLGRYLDCIGQERIKSDWGDTLFRRIRHFNTSMESWTLAVVVVESTAQIFYQSLKDAVSCPLLKQICTDILIDEAYHITFQTDRLAILFEGKTAAGKFLGHGFYRLFFFMTSVTVWMAHKKLFKAGGNTFSAYMKKMSYKYRKTVNRITSVKGGLGMPVNASAGFN